MVRDSDPFVIPLGAIDGGDTARVGGKNASLGEMISRLSGEGVRVPDGFATTATACRRFLREGGLDEEDVLPLARWAVTVEEHYGRPMDMEWARDGESGELFLVQARPETVQSRREAARFRSFRLTEKASPVLRGLAVGSNDLTQLVLGVDRDSEELVSLFDERHEAVKRAVRMLVEAAHNEGVAVDICGQAPSDHPEFAAFLVEAGIDSISLNPDSVLDVIRRVAAAERREKDDRHGKGRD